MREDLSFSGDTWETEESRGLELCGKVSTIPGGRVCFLSSINPALSYSSDDVPSDGSKPEGNPKWKIKRLAVRQGRIDKRRKTHPSPWDDVITPRFSEMDEGERLTPERLQAMLEGVQSTLSPEERDLFTHILKNREAALAWDFSHVGKIELDVFPPQEIRTIPHTAW